MSPTPEGGPDTPPSPRNRRALLTALGLFLGALGVRALHVASFHGNEFAYFGTPTLDAHTYDAFAREVLGGRWVMDRPFEAVPLYGYFLAGAYALTGTGPVGIALVQAVLGAVGVVLLHGFCRRVFGERIALVTGVLAAIYPPFLLYESLRLAEGLALFCASSVLVVSLRFLEVPTMRRALVAGLVLGLAGLARERFLLFAPLLVVAFVLPRRRKLAAALAPVGLLIAGMAAPLSLSLAHNVAAADDWVLLSSVGGVNFYMGNRPGASGAFEVPPEFGASRRDQYLRAEVLAEEAEGRDLRASEVSRYWAGRGFAFWREEPGAALALAGRKLVLFWKGIELTDLFDLQLARDHSAVLAAPLPGFRLLGPLALLGLWVVWRIPERDRGGVALLLLLLAANVGFLMLFFVSSRFRTSAMPCVLPFSAVGAVWLFDAVRGMRWSRAGLGALLLGGSAWFVNADPPTFTNDDATTRFNHGQLLFREKRYAEAEPEFAAAVEANPGFGKAWFYLAEVHKLDGRHQEAYGMFQRALDLDPHYGRGRTFYGSLLIDLRRFDEAAAQFERALVDDPRLGIAAVGLGLALENLGRRQEAIEAYTRAVQIDPSRLDYVNGRLRPMGIALTPADG